MSRPIRLALALTLTLGAHRLPAQVRVTGAAFDSVARKPLVGASVIATPDAALHDTSFHAAVTDGLGRFTFTGLQRGPYTFTVDAPVLDSMGLTAPARTIVLSGADTVIALGLPSALGFARMVCGRNAGDTTAAVAGRVQLMGGAPAAGATVVVSWSDFDVNRQSASVTTKRITGHVVADSSGVYRMCGVPLGRSLLLQAQGSADVQSGVVEEQVGATHVLVRDFIMSRVAEVQPSDTAKAPVRAGVVAVADTSPPLGRFAVSGHVQGVDGHPIASAQVRLFGTGRAAASNDSGEFHLTGLPGGTQGIEVVALGYYPRRTRVDVGEGTGPLTVRMEKAAVVLDSIRVVARRVNNPNAASYREFDERRAAGHGRYLAEDQIEKRNAFQTTDLFRTMPGLSVSSAASSSDEFVVSNRGNGFQGRCAMQVFIDGMQVQPNDINLIPPSSIHGIEVYSVGTAPARYHVMSCGAILVWTK